jgi:hypothetical protein
MPKMQNLAIIVIMDVWNEMQVILRQPNLTFMARFWTKLSWPGSQHQPEVAILEFVCVTLA